MSRPAHHEFVQRILKKPHIAGKDVLRVGLADLDPLLRLMAEAYGAASYVGADPDLSPTVCATYRVEHLLARLGPESFDLLICSELLQHVEDWRRVISTLKRLIRAHGWLLFTTRSHALPKEIMPRDLAPQRTVETAPAGADPGKPTVFREHPVAHALLDGLSGLEIGAAAHNPFGLRTRNVALPEGYEFYAEHQRREMGVEPAPVDIWASADHIPVPDASEDFVISSHVVEHLPNVIGAFLEWDRIVRDGGYVFMIVPLKGALPADDSRELTPLAHCVEDAYLKRTLDTHPIAAVPGGKAGHYHTFTPDSLLQVVEWMRINRFCEWEPVAREDIDRKVGNGFTLAFKVRHTTPRADITRPNWRYELADMEAIFSDFEILTLEADPSEPGVFLLARKPAGFHERDLTECPLFSVTANRRLSAPDNTASGVGGGGATAFQELYDERYFDMYKSTCGIPYRRSGPWLDFFAGVAERIVHEVNPRTVLDVGCAKGFLVEALRDRKVAAFGLDISEYAISQCREDMKPYCWVASVVDPFPGCYDLIVCIEVLEHLPKKDAELAVANLCKHADNILFSSTPDDFTEFTHLNVQPVEYWAALFARHGFYRDVDFEASFVAEHAARFRKATDPVHTVIRAYERARWRQLHEGRALRHLNLELTREKQRLESQLTQTTEGRGRLEDELRAAGHEARRLGQAVKERDDLVGQLQTSLAEKDSRVGSLEADLREIQSSLGWALLSRYSRARDTWFPSGSRSRRFYDLVVQSLKRGLSRGVRVSPWHAPATLSRKAAPVDASAPGRENLTPFPVEHPSRPWDGQVLMISGSDGDMERYRCFHAQEQLRLHGIRCDVRPLTNATLSHLVSHYDLLILHRVPHSEFVEDIVRTARARGRITLFDIDDLVFDSKVAASIDALRWMEPDEQALYMDGVRRYQLTLEICDGALLATEYLAQAVAQAGKPAWVHRNALSLELLEISAEAVRTQARPTDKVVIGYASGTRTHHRDFQEAEIALERILRAYPQVELWIIGHLDLDERWAGWGSRVRRIPFMPWCALPTTLAQLDINLAPLEPGSPFCMAKSELKYVEAAAVGVPTVATRVGAFEFAIRHGENGLLATSSEDWFEALDCLVTNPSARLVMGERARSDTLQRYHPLTRGAELLATLHKVAESLGRTSAEGTSCPSPVALFE